MNYHPIVKPLSRRWQIILYLLLWLNSSQLNAQTPDEITVMTEAAWNLFPDKAENAAEIGQKALELALNLQLDNDSIIAKCYQLIGVANYYQSRMYSAGNYFQKALATQCGQQNTKLSAAFWNNLGIIYDHQDHIKEAVHAYNQALNISTHLADSTGMMLRWINLSLLENKLGNNQRALDLCEKAFDYASSKQDSSRIAFCHQNFSLFYEQLGDQNKTNYHYRQALDYYKQLNDQYHTATLLLNRSIAESKNGALSNADVLIKQGILICENNHLDNILAPLLVQRAANAICRGVQLTNAEKDLDRALQLYLQVGRTDKIAALFEIKSRLFAKMGKFNAFAIAMDSFVTITNRTTNNNALDTYQEMQALYELERKNQSIQQLQSDVNARNLQLAMVSTLLVSIIAGAIAVTYQHLRLRRYVKSLFQMNAEQAHKPAISVIAEPVTEVEAALLELFNRILQKMESEKWYLNTQLGLQDIATKMGSNQTYVSQAINTYSGNNLAGFVNRFRVNEARRLLLSSNRKLAMTEVAVQSGFANRVSFYRQFKEITGFSPSEFLELASNPETPEDSVLTSTQAQQ